MRYLHHWTKGKELIDQERLLNEVRSTAHNFISTRLLELLDELAVAKYEADGSFSLAHPKI